MTLVERLQDCAKFFTGDYGYPQAATCQEAATELAARNARIEELTRERDKSARAWRDSFDSMHQRAMTAEQQVAVLREALHPFAEGEKLFNDWCADETPAWYLDNEGDDTDHSSVTVGDFRRACAALGDGQ